jgi:hypothetical protein
MSQRGATDSLGDDLIDEDSGVDGGTPWASACVAIDRSVSRHKPEVAPPRSPP